jgi:hypothetical protein
MRRLFFVLLLGAAAPACKDSGTTFTFDSGTVIDAPKTADGGGGDGASSDARTPSDVATPSDAASSDGGEAGADAGGDVGVDVAVDVAITTDDGGAD